ncbi:hypothetical protein ES319_A04G090500v1 [Gossypium barbadense]|uniref:Uncharacterized protein n=2 Tax=Gossypium TaxID=3633 RepID=A0A5J5W4Z4_GOSBA|nr:hypothetical protein ES319_A04G090500v1 [Gossypium barbadense]TYH22129.1 hypothetical protein ES288_A04G102600v1 [Gossypium darwinii]
MLKHLASTSNSSTVIGFMLLSIEYDFEWEMDMNGQLIVKMLDSLHCKL